MICSRGGDLRRWIRCGKHFPAIIGHLKLVQIERRQVIHEITFDLTAKDENLGPQDVERMAVSARWPWSGR
jgi:hypothetical protein